MGLWAFAWVIGLGSGSDSGTPAPATRVYTATIGVRIQAHANGKRYVAGTVLPLSHAEQTVTIESSTCTRCRARVKTLGEGGRVLIVATEPLRAGELAEATYVCRIEVRSIPLRDPPPLHRPRRPGRELRPYLTPSPGIESDDRRIKDLATSLAQGKTTDWDRARAFFDWVHDEVRYQGGEFTSAKIAVQSRVGDCEEKAAIFIALCRASGIPARTVWSPGHCWAEFCLVDADGKGHWIPAHTSGDRWFGRLDSANVILQKGDQFTVPESKSPKMRILGNWYHGYDPKPTVEFRQDIVPAGSGATPSNASGRQP